MNGLFFHRQQETPPPPQTKPPVPPPPEPSVGGGRSWASSKPPQPEGKQHPVHGPLLFRRPDLYSLGSGFGGPGGGANVPVIATTHICSQLVPLSRSVGLRVLYRCSSRQQPFSTGVPQPAGCRRGGEGGGAGGGALWTGPQPPTSKYGRARHTVFAGVRPTSWAYDLLPSPVRCGQLA